MPEDKIKQVIVIRRDLGMRRGKEIAQGSHSSMIFLVNAFNYYFNDNSCSDPDCCGSGPAPVTSHLSAEEIEWMQGKFTKVTLQVNSEEELQAVYDAAEEAGLEVNMVEDEGLTEFSGVKTKTCLAIGPDRSSRIDPITRELKLY